VGLAKKNRFHELNQYSLWTADRAVYDPSALLDSQTQTAIGRVSITNDVPVMRIDHVPIKGKLLGMRQALFSGGVLDFKEMNGTSFVPEDFSIKEIMVCKTSNFS
jgi:hypothetical protein